MNQYNGQARNDCQYRQYATSEKKDGQVNLHGKHFQQPVADLPADEGTDEGGGYGYFQQVALEQPLHVSH